MCSFHCAACTLGQGGEGEKTWVYLVIFQVQRSSAKIKFIGFTVDISIRFFMLCWKEPGVGGRPGSLQGEEKEREGKREKKLPMLQFTENIIINITIIIIKTLSAI